MASPAYALLHRETLRCLFLVFSVPRVIIAHLIYATTFPERILRPGPRHTFHTLLRPKVICSYTSGEMKALLRNRARSNLGIEGLCGET